MSLNNKKNPAVKRGSLGENGNEYCHPYNITQCAICEPQTFYFLSEFAPLHAMILTLQFFLPVRLPVLCLYMVQRLTPLQPCASTRQQPLCRLGLDHHISGASGTLLNPSSFTAITRIGGKLKLVPLVSRICNFLAPICFTISSTVEV